MTRAMSRRAHNVRAQASRHQTTERPTDSLSGPLAPYGRYVRKRPFIRPLSGPLAPYGRYVRKRPFLDRLIDVLRVGPWEVVVFTASVRSVDSLIDD